MARKRNVTVEGFRGEHTVVENLGYSHDRNCWALAVLIDNSERIVTGQSRRGPWRISVPVIAPGTRIQVGMQGD